MQQIQSAADTADTAGKVENRSGWASSLDSCGAPAISLAGDEDEPGDDAYILKPMNCPHHIEVYQHEIRSYRNLPLRLLNELNQILPRLAMHTAATTGVEQGEAPGGRIK